MQVLFSLPFTMYIRRDREEVLTSQVQVSLDFRRRWCPNSALAGTNP